ncbi:MAG: glycosyltransferase [Pedobacter sp.]
MAIPNIIHQTFKSQNLPWITRWHISRFRKNNPEFTYEFYDDERIRQFLRTEYSSSVLALYDKIQIGAAKADFFRYAVLNIKGGVYLDIDSSIPGKLKDLILPDDVAVISIENNSPCYIQWALIYAAGHPFLKKTLELMFENIRLNKHPHNVHHMTGPTVYTNAVQQCLLDNPDVLHRVLPPEYNNKMKFKYKLSKFFLYNKREDHWKTQQLTSSVLKPENLAQKRKD